MQSSNLFPTAYSRSGTNSNQGVTAQGQQTSFHQTIGHTHHVSQQGAFNSPQVPPYQQGFPQVIKVTAQPFPRGGMPMPQPQAPTHMVGSAGRDYQQMQNQNPGNIGRGDTMFSAAYNRK